MTEHNDMSSELRAAGWRTIEDAFGEQAEPARELLASEDHRAHRSGDLLSPSLVALIRRHLRWVQTSIKRTTLHIVPLTRTELATIASLGSRTAAFGDAAGCCRHFEQEHIGTHVLAHASLAEQAGLPAEQVAELQARGLADHEGIVMALSKDTLAVLLEAPERMGEAVRRSEP